MDYWAECISQACGDYGVSATDQQIRSIAEAVKGAYENYGMYSGNEQIERSFYAQLNQENNRLKKDLCKEREKVRCTECGGTGYVYSGSGEYRVSLHCKQCHSTGQI